VDTQGEPGGLLQNSVSQATFQNSWS
jgi:hypothetical protein